MRSLSKRIRSVEEANGGNFKRFIKPLTTYLALLTLVLCATASWSDNGVVEAARQLDRVRINGWTEVNKRWPLEESEFFVALEKGHHFIEVKLPPRLNHDLDIKLEYYYDYERVRPVFQMVPCSTNVDIIKNTELNSQRADYIDEDRYVRDSAQPAGKWLTHEMRVSRHDCEIRKELAYNVLLHDQNDVFAWRVIEIKSVSPVSTPPSLVTTTTEAVEQADTTQVPTTQAPTTQLPTTTQEPTNELVASDKPSDSPQNVPFEGTEQPGEEEGKETTTRRPESDISDNQESPLNRRATLREEDGDEDVSTSLVCRPSSCDRSLFRHPRFMPLVKGVPKLPRPNLLAQNYKYYLNTNNQELQFSQTSNEDFSEVNLCVDLELYMDPDTAIEFYVEDKTSEAESKLLEVIERKSSTVAQNEGKWERFKRCIDDYAPKLRPVDPNGHSIKLKFVPRPAAFGKQVALLANPQRSVSLSQLYPPRDYLPNVVTLPVGSQVASYWILDKDGHRQPFTEFKTQVLEESTSADAGPKRVLHISNIDPKQESFDITSRWLKVSDLETLDHPIFFYYRADRAEWIKAVDFEFQKATYPSDTWNSQTVYVEYNPIEQDIYFSFEADIKRHRKVTSTYPDYPKHRHGVLIPATDSTIATTTIAPPSGDQPTTDGSTGIDTTTTTTTTTTSTTSTTTTESAVISRTTVAPPLAGQMLIPIQLKGLNADEFRIRVRHHLKEEAQRSDASLDLNIVTLAFADACAESNFCLNGGQCRPTGTATAQCSCLPGYYGQHCQIVKPCEMIYEGRTGNQLCESVGAKCEQSLPVLRCRWPNDQYYECRVLFQEIDNANGTGQAEVVPIMSVTELEERSNDQTRTIIILAVFMAALLLFSVVIIGNMVSRLVESRKRLRKAEHEVHELARRSQPGSSTGSGGAFGRLTGRHKPAATVSYNNQAFDTE